MRFCEGPEQALAVMEEEPYDVIVTDLRMPIMDGAEFLTRVRQLYPDMVRILLSNQHEQEQILRGVGLAHQYLSKPCDPEFLRLTITRATLFNKRMTNHYLRNLVSRMDSLPSLPDIYFKLTDELHNEEGAVDRVGALIASDLGMTAKVLQLVNSSYFGLPVHITDAKHAVALLGLNTLKPLVLTASIFRQLEATQVPHAYLESILSHSMTVGGLAKRLSEAEGCNRETQDQSFIAGALHDIGKIVLADNFGSEQTSLELQAAVQEKTVEQLEIERFGAPHADVGGYLLGLWGLPQNVLEAVAYHHDPTATADTSFTPLTAVHVANALCASMQEESVAPPAAIDRQYVAQLDLENHVESWYELASEGASLI